MEENSSYTYTYEDEEQAPKPERSLKIIFALVVAGLAVLAIALGIFFGIRSANEEETTTETPVTTTEAPVSTTEPVETSPYKTGLYTIETDGVSLKFRKDHASNSDTILTIPNKTKVEVLEIFFDEATTDEDFKYWGKTSYQGHTGWVSMKYLKKAYSDNVVTPDSTTTTLPSSSDVPTSAQSGESTTHSSVATTVPTTVGTASQNKYPTGKYTVSADGQGLNVRSGAGSSNSKVDTVSDGTTVTVLEVVDTKGTDEKTRYWGKISYDGKTGYVCMAYLKK